MHVRHKPNDPAITDPIGGTAAARPAALVDGDSPHQADDAPVSPARLLHEHLAARLADTARSNPPAPSVASAESNAKLPVMLRIAIIVALSAALWSGLYLAIAHIITI